MVLDLGTDDAARVDYPDFAHALCRAVEAGQARFGVLVCGSGVGMSIAANRHPGIRCVLAGEPLTATLARAHNDANVLALGARLIGEDMALAILRAFLAGRYEGGRHDGAARQAHPVPEGLRNERVPRRRTQPLLHRPAGRDRPRAGRRDRPRAGRASRTASS